MVEGLNEGWILLQEGERGPLVKAMSQTLLGAGKRRVALQRGKWVSRMLAALVKRRPRDLLRFSLDLLPHVNRS